jgi:HSP20 family protein
MTDKDRKKEDGVSFDLGLGGMFKGLSTLLDAASRLAEKSEEIRRNGQVDLGELGQLKGLKDLKAVYGINVRTMSDGRSSVSHFGNIKKTPDGPVVEPIREPMVDVFESPDQLQVIAEMPGVDKDDIRLALKGDILVLSAETGTRKYRKEVLLPRPVKEDEMHWNFKNGVLEIRISA